MTGNDDDALTLDVAVDTVSLGSGDDDLRLAAEAGTVHTGSGDDSVVSDAAIRSLRLGSGDDSLVASAPVASVHAGSGDDSLFLEAGAGAVFAGGGDDLIFAGAPVGSIAGGGGEDTLQLTQTLAAFDIAADGDTIRLVDRITGQETRATGVEVFDFNGETVGYEDLAEDYAFGNSPVIRVRDGTQFTTVNDIDPSVSVVMDRAAQLAVIDSAVPTGPTGASRAYALVHTAMFDAWASYDPDAVRVSFDASGNNAALESGLVVNDANKQKAMAFAGHAVLSALFPDQAPIFDTILTERYGFTLGGDGSAEADVGLDAAADLMALRLDDGANQENNYADTSGYTPLNADPESIVDIVRWTPERVPIESGDDATLQRFLTPHWSAVESFALPESPDGLTTDFPSLGITAPQTFFVVGLEGSVLDADAGTITLAVDVTTGAGVIPAGSVIPVTKALIGSVINPGFIEQAEQVVAFSAELTAEQRMIAEFWEDAGGTAFPPGTSMTFAEVVSARDGNSIDDDAKLFFTLGNAVMDAGIATWWSKVESDYTRPVRAIIELGKLGLIGEADGVDELTGEVGYVIEAFGGFDPVTGAALGTRTILAENWDSYQRPFGPSSPPFAEDPSGHSTFTAAGAAVLRLATGSPDFGASVTFEPGSAQFDPTLPPEAITLEWATFLDAANQAGLSRRLGGIHFEHADLEGRKLGLELGEAAYALAEKFIDGTATDADRPFFEMDPMG